MIEAAERLAVERGLGAVSLREVQLAAGQRNKSAAQYHFGNREGLLSAIIEKWMAPVNARRLELLAALDAVDRPPTVRQLVEALVEPLAEVTVGRRGSRYARFLAQGLFDPTVTSIIRHHLRYDSFREVRRRLVASLDHLGSDVREWRVDHIVVMVVTTLAIGEGHGWRAHASAHVADLVDSCVAVLNGSTSDITRNELESSTRRHA